MAERARRLDRMLAYPVDGDTQLVEYVSVDDGMGPGSVFHAELAADAAERARDGWALVSMSVYPLRNGSTSGSMLSNGGGNYATVLGATALFRRVSTPAPTVTAPVDGAAGYP